MQEFKFRPLIINICIFAVTCPILSLTNGQITPSPTNGKYTYGTWITFSCNNGYRLDTSGHQSASSARCSDTGMWSHNTPECDRSIRIFIHIKYATCCFPTYSFSMCTKNWMKYFQIILF